MNGGRRGVLSWPVNLKGIVAQVTIHSIEEMREVPWHPDSMNALFFFSNTVLHLLRGNRPPPLAKSHSSQEDSKRPLRR